MKIGIIGSGLVAQTLAAGFLKHGHSTMLGTRDATQLKTWLDSHPKARVESPGTTAAAAEVVVLAVKGTAAIAVLQQIGPAALSGKVVIDATNPISDAPPDHGVLKFFTTMNGSLMEQLQGAYPATRFVKAFNSVGAPNMVNPTYAAGSPTMFICGNDAAAKKTVTALLAEFGWDSADMGTVEAARAIEPLCMLWCIPGFLRNEWTHAFKLLK